MVLRGHSIFLEPLQLLLYSGPVNLRKNVLNFVVAEKVRIPSSQSSPISPSSPADNWPRTSDLSTEGRRSRIKIKK